MSIQSRIIAFAGRFLLKPATHPHLNLEKLRRYDLKKPVRKLYNCQFAETQIAGVSVTTIQPPRQTSDAILLYVHGGGYVAGPTPYEYTLIAKLCAETGRRVFSVNYRLAPEHPYPAAITDAQAVYSQLVTEHGPENLTMLGDSAGGGLVVATLLKAKDEGQPMPARMVLFAPFLDITLQNPDITPIEPKDPLLGRQGIIEGATLYAGDEDPTHPYLSPVNGDLAGLPPVLLQIGTYDILWPDCRLFRERAEAAGASIQYTEAAGMFHVYMSALPFVPEARQAVREAVVFIQQGG